MYSVIRCEVGMFQFHNRGCYKYFDNRPAWSSKLFMFVYKTVVREYSKYTGFCIYGNWPRVGYIGFTTLV